MALTGEDLIEQMDDAERQRVERAETIPPTLRATAREIADKGGFRRPHCNILNYNILSESGLLGLFAPDKYGGPDGAIRDPAAFSFAICHCSSASRELRVLRAVEAVPIEEDEAWIATTIAEKVQHTMGRDGNWAANSAGESARSENAIVTLTSRAVTGDGGIRINGVKSFGFAAGVAERYTVTVALEEFADELGLCAFLFDREAENAREREQCNAVDMRTTAPPGLILTGVIAADDDAMAIPGGFARTAQLNRRNLVGNQRAGLAVYSGATWAFSHDVIGSLTRKISAASCRALGAMPLLQQFIGEIMARLETAMSWPRRRLELETAAPPVAPREEIVERWRIGTGKVSEYAFRVVQPALATWGVARTSDSQRYGRMLRDLAIGRVQAFPAGHERLMAARMTTEAHQQRQFGVGESCKLVLP